MPLPFFVGKQVMAGAMAAAGLLSAAPIDAAAIPPTSLQTEVCGRPRGGGGGSMHVTRALRIV